MVTPPLIVTDHVLDELIDAMRISLGRVRAADLGSATAREHWRQVQAWLAEAERFSQADKSNGQFARLKPFPITGAELHALQVAVDRAAAQPQAQQMPDEEAENLHRQTVASAPATPLMRLIASLHHVELTSLAVAVLLACALALSIADLVIFHLGHEAAVVSANVAATTLALAAWAFHHWHLRQHIHLVHFHWPHGRHPHPPAATSRT